MDANPRTILERLRRIMGGWIITLVLFLSLGLGLVGFVKGTNANASASGYAQATAIPANPALTTLPSAGNNIDALTVKMQAMMQSLQGMVGQLEQKSLTASAPPPTAVPAVNMQVMMAELHDINRLMGPLVLRIQTDLQGSSSAEELASVRAQVAQLNTRMAHLMIQLQAARGNEVPVTPIGAMPGMSSAQHAGNMGPAAGNQQMQPGGMMGGMSQSTSMSGMSNSNMSMNDVMSTMDTMRSMIDSTMKMNTSAPMSGMGGMSQGASMSGMSNANTSMDDMMRIMDDMLRMMDGMMGGM